MCGPMFRVVTVNNANVAATAILYDGVKVLSNGNWFVLIFFKL